MADDKNEDLNRSQSINKEAEKYISLLKEQAKERQKVSTSLDGYLQGLKKVNALSKTISDNDKIRNKLLDESKKLSGDDKKLNDAKLKILQAQTSELTKQKNELEDTLKDVNKGNLVMAKSFGNTMKAISGLPNVFKSTLQEIRNLGLFDMDKAAKKAALSMGLMGNQSDVLENSLKNAAEDTTSIGVGMDQLAKMQSEYADNIGRNVEFTNQGLKAMAKLAAATGLGADGAAKMAADMDNFGYSAERTTEFVQQTVGDVHSMGLNAAKVIKNISSNMKMLNKYNFKDGVKGLAKMAETVSKLGVDMGFVGSMADKLFDIEGAVDMSAQLQVLGGAWAKLADPFHLMYMARNDMAGLAQEIGEAAGASATFNKQTGSFEVSALEMQRLRKVSEQTGIAFEDLVTSAKNFRKFSEIGKQIKFNVPKDLQEFIKNTSVLNQNGEAEIMIKGEPKLVKTLNQGDISLLKSQKNQKDSLEDMAKKSMNFDDALKNTLDMFKTALLPLVMSINEKLLPKINNFVQEIKNNKWIDKVESFAKKVGNLVSSVAGFVIDNPIKSVIGAVTAIGLLDAGKWFLNGVAMGKGFNMTAGMSGGLGGGNVLGGSIGAGSMKMLGQSAEGSIGSNFMGAAGSGLAKFGGVLAGFTTAITEYNKNAEKGVGTGENLIRSGTKGLGSGLGGWGGAAAGAAIGTAILPGIGTIIGGLLGGAAGAWGGGQLGEQAGNLIEGSPVKDGIFDSDSSRNRGIVQGGVVTPIDNKDSLMAYKPNGVIDNAMKNNIPDSLKIEFGPLNINMGELKITSPGSPGVAVDLLKDPKFLRDITRMVHIETTKAINGGVINPSK